MISLVLPLLVGCHPSPQHEGAAPAFSPSVWGLELAATEVRAAAQAYAGGFGFRLLTVSGEHARLVKDGLVLVLSASRAPAGAGGAASVYLDLEARDLELALEQALAAGFQCEDLEPRTTPIGLAVTVFDADGYPTNLFDLDPAAGVGEEGIAVYRLGLDLEAAADWEFIERLLGFRVFSRAYLPEALPIARAGAAGLVLHRSARAPRANGTRSAALLLAVESLEPAVSALAPLGLADREALPRAAPHGRVAALRAPSNLRIELVERGPAQLAFERLQALAGSWEGRSSAGWVSRSEIEVIARGSVVLERTNFEAHPGETMLTLFHKDGAELVLTHYRVAGNQPRLVASAIDGGDLHFTFRDATNLQSRDQGHMDEVVLRLEGADAFSSRWSFHQAGKTSWMEEIRYRRIVAATATAPAGASAPDPGAR